MTPPPTTTFRQLLTRYYQNFFWLLLLPLLPLTFIDNPEFAPLFLIIPVLWLLRLLLSGRLTPSTPLNGALWLLLFMVGVSLWATYDWNVSIDKATAILFGVALLWALVDVVGRDPRRLWLALILFLLAGVAVAGIALIGTQWGTKLPLIGRAALLVRSLQPALPGGIPQFNANQIAGTLLWVLPLALALAGSVVWHGRVLRQRWGTGFTLALQLFLAATALFLLGTFLLTQSRGGYLGFALAMGLMILLAAGRWGKWLLLLGGLLVVGFGGYTAVVGPEQALAPLFDATGASLDDFDGGDMETLSGRLEIWSRAIYAAQDFPFTGMGLNTFRTVVHILYPLFTISPDTDIAHAHNHLLHTAVELGHPGLIAYLALWFGLTAMLWQMWQPASQHPLWRGLLIGMAGALIGYFAYGMFDAVALGAKPGFLLWFLWGLLAAAHHYLCWHSRQDLA
jgi:putative inorganic carbon (hco3(-)) transporter